MEREIDISYALLAIQRALLGEITSNLRAVIVDFQPLSQAGRIEFYYDQEISEEIYDHASGIITEITAAFPPQYHFEEKIERLDYPKKISVKGRLAYLRKEL